MDLDDHGFLEELLSLRREPWEAFPAGMSEFFSGADGSLDCFQESSSAMMVPPSFHAVPYDGGVSAAPLVPSSFDCLSEVYCPFSSALSATAAPPPDVQSGMDDEELRPVHREEKCGGGVVCKVEMAQSAETPGAFGVGGGCMERKKKKVEGMPSKNLMAERRRRKRLNDRLSMLRSVVPKISKMDRTSILGDTIDYMKELLERIKRLKEEIDLDSPEQVNLLSIFKELTPNEILVRNSPKFDVERREGDTRIEICCAAKPGLLLSTVNTLEALGLEIRQCVASCFNDFGMQASCSEDVEKRAVMSSEDIKQALFRNAGYGGRCL